MRRFSFPILVGIAALAAAAPAAATVTVNGASVTFDNTAGPNSVSISYNGLGGDPTALTPGLNAILTLTLTGIVGNTFNFGYSMQNTSTVANTRLSGFGFDVGPNNVSGLSSTGVFNQFATNAQFASQGQAEVCFHGGPGTCPQSNPGNSIGFGATGSGTLALTFNSPQTTITLSNFLNRYQGFETNNVLGREVSSAIGRGTPVGAVPEPGTWAMMLLGFGGIGYAMRRRRTTTGIAQLA